MAVGDEAVDAVEALMIVNDMVDLEEDDQKVAMRNRNERAKATSWVALKS